MVGRKVNRANITAHNPWATRNMSKYFRSAQAMLTDFLELAGIRKEVHNVDLIWRYDLRTLGA